MKSLIAVCLLAVAGTASAVDRSPEHCTSTTALIGLPYWQYNVYTTVVTATPPNVLSDITIISCFTDKLSCDASRLDLNPPVSGAVIVWSAPNQNATRVVGPCYKSGN